MESTTGEYAGRDFQEVWSGADEGPLAAPVAPAPSVQEKRFWKLRCVVRRRALLTLAVLVLASGAYVLLGLNAVTTYRGEAILVVPAVTAGQLPPGDPDAAAKLAKTYATAIPLNRELLTAAAAKAGTGNAYLSSHLTMTNDLGTSVVRLTYDGQSPASTAAVLGYLTSRLIASNPPAPVIPGSVKLVSVPDTVTKSGGSPVDRVPLGIVLGLVAGLACAYVVETARPRVDSELECADATGVPVALWDSHKIFGLEPLLARLSAATGPDSMPEIEVVGVDAKSSQDVRDVARQIAAAAWNAGPPRSPARVQVAPALTLRGLRKDEPDEPIHVWSGSLFTVRVPGAGPATLVVVIRRGTPRTSVVVAAKRLANQDRPAAWAVLGPARGFRAPARSSAHPSSQSGPARASG
jgi:capsular polysaccharide biosynthesis protein